MARPAHPLRPDTDTGVPWLRTWRRVYLFVAGVVILWMSLLTILMRTFS